MFSRFRKGMMKQRYDVLDDRQIIGLYREERDGEMIGVLFKRYTHLVYGLCLKYLKNEDDAEDAVMDIFEGLFSALLEHDVTSFKSWLYSVARNHCLMKIRKEKTGLKVLKGVREENREAVMELIDEMHQNSVHDNYSVEMLRSAISTLKDEQRKCIELVYLQEKTYEEVSGITGYALKKVKSYIQNGKRNLRIKLEKQSAEER